MAKINDGGGAFPRPVGNNGADHFADRVENVAQDGMSLRDWFAGQALASIGSNTSLNGNDIADHCYMLANAMIRAREEFPMPYAASEGRS